MITVLIIVIILILIITLLFGLSSTKKNVNSDKNIKTQKIIFEIDSSKTEKKEIENSTKKIVENEPEKVANLIKNLMSEDKNDYGKKR